MCVGKAQCNLLGDNPSLWSRKSPLPPPTEFFEIFNLIRRARELLEINDIEAARRTLNSPLESLVKEWFKEHAQMSGINRNSILKLKSGNGTPIEIDPVASIAKYEYQVYERDKYSCRYCGIKVFGSKELKLIESKIGKDFFAISGKSNDTRHGFVYVARATADHVVPHNRGGRTSLENLVTSCWACNYGKSGYTLEEIALDNPFSDLFIQ